MKNILNHKIMGYIKEQKGVDFIIKSEPLTDKERIAISQYIADYKKKESLKKKTSRRKEFEPA